MPLMKCSIEPKYVSRRVVPQNISNELDCISNSTLACIIYQLSSLSRLSEELFSELHRETSVIVYRTCQLNERIEDLKGKIVQLNPEDDEVLLQDVSITRPFRSSIVKEQQLLSLHSRPTAIAEIYAQVDSPPPLHILTLYREDGKDSMKFYTDPGYFFELWSQEIAKEAESQLEKHRHHVGRSVERPGDLPSVHQLENHCSEMKLGLHGAGFASSLQCEERTGFHKTPKESFDPGEDGLIFKNDGFSRSSRSASSQGLASHPIYPSIRHERKPARSETVRVHSPSQRIARDEKRCSFHAVPHGVNQHHSGSATMPHDAQHPISTCPVTNPCMESSYSPLYSGQSITTSNTNHNVGNFQQNPTVAYSSSEHRQQSIERKSSSEHRSEDSIEMSLPPSPPMELPPSYYPMPSSPPIPSAVPAHRQNVFLSWSPVRSPHLHEASSLAPMETRPFGYVGMFPKQHHSDKHFQNIAHALDGEEIVDVMSADVNLLAAIKKGIQLRQVEERRLETAQTRHSKAEGRLDVQAVMEAAFEMRRRALDENDSDGNSDEPDNSWSDDY